MLRFAIATIIICAAGAASAAERVSQRDLLDGQERYKDKTIRLLGMNCISEPKSAEFVCLAKVGGRWLRLTALSMDENTTMDAAEIIQTECTGTANFERRECVFDVEIKPVTFQRIVADTKMGSVPVVTVNSRLIDFFKPRR